MFGNVSLDLYFALARGNHGSTAGALGHGLPALEMTKWFDTNYHYMVPEFTRGQEFTLASTKAVDEFKEAKALPIYTEILRRLEADGADWVQIDEPCLVLDLDETTKKALHDAYSTFADNLPGLKLLLTTYFGGLDNNLETALALPVSGLHLDLVRAPDQLERAVTKASRDLVLSLGVIDGRNVWRANLPALLDRIEPIVAQRGTEHVIIAPSCSLLQRLHAMAIRDRPTAPQSPWQNGLMERLIGSIRRECLDTSLQNPRTFTKHRFRHVLSLALIMELL